MGQTCSELLQKDEGSVFIRIAKENYLQKQYTASIWNYDRAIEYYSQKHGAYFPKIAEIQLQVADILDIDLKTRESLARYQSAFNILFKTYGYADERLLEIAKILSTRYWNENKYEEAAEYNRMVLDQLIEARGPYGREVDVIHDKMGSILADLGDYQQAVKHFQFSLDIKKMNQTLDVDSLANEYNKVGLVYLDNLKDYDNARRCFDNVLKIMEASHGEKHEEISIAYLNLSNVMIKLKEYTIAKKHALKCLEIAAEVPWQLPETKRQTLEVGFLLAAALEEADGDWESSIYYEKQWALLHLESEDLEEADYHKVYFSRVAGNLTYEAGNSKEAISYYNQTLQFLSQMQPPDDVEIGRTMFRMAIAYMDVDDTECERLLNSAESHFNLAYKENCDDKIEIIRYMGILRLRQQKFSEGMNLLAKALKQYQERYGQEFKEHIAIVEILFEMGLGYKLYKKYAEAVQYFTKALEMRRSHDLGYLRCYSDGEPVTYEIEGIFYDVPDLDRIKDIYFEVFELEVKRMTIRHEIFQYPRVLPDPADIDRELMETKNKVRDPNTTPRRDEFSSEEELPQVAVGDK